MEKIAILVDSAADIDENLANSLNIYTLPLYVNLDSRYYKDREEISPEEFYDWVRNNDKMPKTSTASPADAISLYEKIKENGYDKVLAISLSKGFSGTYNLLNMTKPDDLEVYVFDSGSLTMAEGFFAIYAKELIEKDLSFKDIIEKLIEKREASHVYFTIETFKYLVEGGRVPRTFGKIGDVLTIKPIITVDSAEGAFKLLKLARGEKKVLRELRKIAERELANAKEYYFFISHGGYQEGLEKLEEKLGDFIANAKKSFKYEITPTLGANTGPGLLGIGFFIVD